MKLETYSRKKIVLLVGAICATVAVTAGFALAALHFNKQENGKAQARDKQILRAQYKHGVVSQVKFARTGDSTDAVRESVGSVASFIKQRSGFILSDAVMDRLTSLEEESLNDPQKRISAQELTSILVRTAGERLAALTDDEIVRIRTVMDHGSYTGDPNAISLRGSRGCMSLTEFTATINNARKAGRSQQSTFQQSLRQAIANEVNERFDSLNEYASNHFGGIKQHGVTPLQAVLLIYSVVSDDSLSLSQETLEAQTQELYGRFPRAFKQGPPFVYAFGSKGYRYATSLEVILDEQTMRRLLDRLAGTEAR